MGYKIAWIKGDGIGPEISETAFNVVEALESKYNLNFEIVFYDAGDVCLTRRGTALPSETVEGFKRADVAIKGPVGETSMDATVKLRQMFDLYANIRPVKNFPNIECVRNIDVVIVRENSEDLYKGFEFELDNMAIALRIISDYATRRIARLAGKIANKRSGLVTIVHKSNVLRKTCGLFSKVAKEELSKYHVNVNEMYVDAASAMLIRSPERFDVILTTNMFGDILSDEAAQIAGSLGIGPSANLGEEKALFEPIHGAAPDIAGKNIANPYAMILSFKMLMEWLGERKNDQRLKEAASTLESAVVNALKMGYKTPDIGGDKKTNEVGSFIHKLIKNL
ncbi:MAG: isocitrate/isopropylmalate dehydrogenase family protein [Nitrososphaeria archaeon]